MPPPRSSDENKGGTAPLCNPPGASNEVKGGHRPPLATPQAHQTKSKGGTAPPLQPPGRINGGTAPLPTPGALKDPFDFPNLRRCPMIDLHSHILPSLDDGAQDIEASLAMAEMAVREDITTVAATPHVSPSYPLDPAAIEDGLERLNRTLAEENVPLSVVAGAEFAATSLTEIDDESLRRLALGGADCLLVESPYVSEVPFFERLIFDLQLRGFRILLAHPERSPMFQRKPDRLSELVARGALCSVTAGSMAGVFGTTVRKFTLTLFREGLVHDVASDSHDVSRRPPGLSAGFRALESELPGISDQMSWFAEECPDAILGGQALPPRPRRLTPRPSTWRRVLRTAG